MPFIHPMFKFEEEFETMDVVTSQSITMDSATSSKPGPFVFSGYQTLCPPAELEVCKSRLYQTLKPK